MSVTHLCLTLCDPEDGNLPGSFVHGISQGKDAGVGNHSLLQGIFPTQGSNSGLLHCRQNLCWVSHQGTPSSIILKSPQTQHFPALPSGHFTMLFAHLSLAVFDINFHSTFPSPYTLTDLPRSVYTF